MGVIALLALLGVSYLIVMSRRWEKQPTRDRARVAGPSETAPHLRGTGPGVDTAHGTQNVLTSTPEPRAKSREDEVRARIQVIDSAASDEKATSLLALYKELVAEGAALGSRQLVIQGVLDSCSAESARRALWSLLRADSVQDSCGLQAIAGMSLRLSVLRQELGKEDMRDLTATFRDDPNPAAQLASFLMLLRVSPAAGTLAEDARFVFDTSECLALRRNILGNAASLGDTAVAIRLIEDTIRSSPPGSDNAEILGVAITSATRLAEVRPELAERLAGLSYEVAVTYEGDLATFMHAVDSIAALAPDLLPDIRRGALPAASPAASKYLEAAIGQAAD